MTQPFAKMKSHQVWLTGPIWKVLCITFIPTYLNNTSTSHLPRHPRFLDQFRLHPFSAVPGIMAPVSGPMVNVGTVTAVRSVKESIPALNAPFVPQHRLLSHHGPLPHQEANTSDIETVTGCPPLQWTMKIEYTYVVHFHLHIVCFPILLMLLCLLHTLCHWAAGSSEPPLPVHAWLPGPFRKILFLPSRVTPIDAQKLWYELSLYSDQVKVDYVITELMSGFQLGFDPLVVSFKSVVHNMA